VRCHDQTALTGAAGTFCNKMTMMKGQPMLNIRFLASDDATQSDVIAIGVFAENTLSKHAQLLDDQYGGAIARALEGTRFTGKPGQTLRLDGIGEGARILCFGLGDGEKLDAAGVERALASVVQALSTSGFSMVSVYLDDAAHSAEMVARGALGAVLAAYRFDKYRTKLSDDKKPSLTQLAIVSGLSGDAESLWAGRYEHVGAGTALARDLVNEPPNVLYPAAFADHARALEKLGVKVTVLGEKEMTSLGMGSLLGVGQGSEFESQLAIMEWKGADAGEGPLALVGKGVCFDTGGISLKPGPGMEEMKGDMGGAAAVLGAMHTLAARKAKAHVVGVIGLVENMPDGKAQRPGDIVTSMSGQTIEIHNTDAEGRLVLADALWYTQETYKPAAMIDLATLTGAIVISLAHEYAGLFASDDALAEAITHAGKTSGEEVWRMPLGDAYDRMIDTPVADMKNIGGRMGGSITAAQFLKRFTNDVPWAHIDIASTAWKSKREDPREPSWATGFGARLLDQLVADRYES
jgi:leucyl aminopeptidase